MPFDEALAERVRPLLRCSHSLKEKRMFGGLAFMVNGHMCCGILGNDFVIRTGPDQYEAALSQPHARPMDFTGRAMRGFVYVHPSGYRSTRDLKTWGSARYAFHPISTEKMRLRGLQGLALTTCSGKRCSERPRGNQKQNLGGRLSPVTEPIHSHRHKRQPRRF